MTPFDIDFSKLIKWMTPNRWKRKEWFAWIESLLTPVTYIYNKFKGNRKDNLYYLNHSPQVVYLQAVLNDRFDPINRQIVIDEGIYYDSPYIYKTVESHPLYVFTTAEAQPVYIFLTEDTFLLTVDFQVLVPNYLSFDEFEMRSLIDKYRLVSKKNYIIVIV